MGRPAPVARMTYAQYLAAEAVADVRHEYLHGDVWAYDRGARWARYRRIASLRDYVLVSQGEPLVEVYRRTEGGRFELLEARAGQTVALASIDAVLDVSVVYANPLEPR